MGAEGSYGSIAAVTESARKLLIVEDDPGIQSQLRWCFEDYEVISATDRETAIVELRRHEPAVVLQDLGLPPDDLKQVATSLRRLRELDWNVLYRHTGFRWEALEHLKAPNGAKVYSLRLSQRIRAVAFRDGDFLRLISLHPDHDSAYER